MKTLRPLLLAMAAALVVACANTDSGGRFDVVEDTVDASLGDAVTDRGIDATLDRVDVAVDDGPPPDVRIPCYDSNAF